MFKDYINYRKGVLEGYKNLGYTKPGSLCILFRYLLNDILRYIGCKLTIWNDIVRKNEQLTEENKQLNEQLNKYRSVLDRIKNT